MPSDTAAVHGLRHLHACAGSNRKLHAESEFEKYRVIQDKLFMSDYDRYMLELEEQLKLQEKNKPTDDNGDSDGNWQE